MRAKSDSAYHPSCTCKMGKDDMAVVDNVGKVGDDYCVEVVIHDHLEGARVGGTAGGGRERNAEHRERQPERPHYHARREAGRCHQVGF